ncbi:MAG TPA: YdcF family protein [Gemmatimonadaceae bacterium]|nr:YdcF family protein [Gemmatimonadaceae bacterium]
MDRLAAIDRQRLRGAAAAATLAVFAYLTLAELHFPIPTLLSRSWGFALIVLAAALVGASGLRRWLWAGAGLLAVALLVVAYTPLIRAPAHALVRTDRWPAAGVDAVVALSAQLTDDQLLSAMGEDRLLSALAVARAHGVPRVVTTRIAHPEGDSVVTSDADQRWLVALAAPRLTHLIVSRPRTTREEALLVAALAADSGWRRVAVVTSPSHTRRACATFEGVGLAVTCVPARSTTVAWRALESPRDRLRAAGMVLYETLGSWLYRARGWI